MLNPDCWGPGESVDTHIVGFGDKKFRGVFYPLQFSSDCLLLYKICNRNAANIIESNKEAQNS